MGMKHGTTVAALLALAACTQSGTENEAASLNESAGEVTTAEPGADNLGNAAETEPADDGVSTTMPVPGTNTPEHIVVDNEVGPNELDGLKDAWLTIGSDAHIWRARRTSPVHGPFV